MRGTRCIFSRSGNRTLSTKPLGSLAGLEPDLRHCVDDLELEHLAHRRLLKGQWRVLFLQP